METLAPATAQDFAEAYGAAYSADKQIRIIGNDTKWRCAGPIAPPDLTLSTSGMREVEEYTPGDLCVRVQTGMPFRELNSMLAECGQMLPLDPPFHDEATIGGVVAANLCGSRRRAYGTARDYVIGVEFVDTQGRRVQSGAMVAKNVAGYDLNKLFVGSWGVLGPMVTVNLRVSPVEKFNHTFAFTGINAPDLGALRDCLLAAPVAPVALDYLNAAAADKMRLDGPTLLARFACMPEVLPRISGHLAGSSFAMPGALPEEPAFYIWQRVREWLNTRTQAHADGVVIQLASQNSRIFHDANMLGGQVVARAASGIVYAAYRDADSAFDTLQYLESQGRRAVLLQASQLTREQRTLWVGQQSDLRVMQTLKEHFDPSGLVNVGRLYGRI
ncbi:MAG: FAD-binding protein [Bryobacterales bacterium]|jgi:glycolate oxidase FAD binding subunit|nr:FAD-binding protein [Bryobacterales bacterium]